MVMVVVVVLCIVGRRRVRITCLLFIIGRHNISLLLSGKQTDLVVCKDVVVLFLFGRGGGGGGEGLWRREKGCRLWTICIVSRLDTLTEGQISLLTDGNETEFAAKRIQEGK